MIVSLLKKLGCKSIPSVPTIFKRHVRIRAVLVDCSEETARRAGAPTCFRGKDAGFFTSFWPSRIDSTPGSTEWKNGRPVSYTRATNDTYVRSFAVLSEHPSGTISYVLHNTQYVITCRTGQWQIDEHGLKLVIGPDDYHPLADDLIADDAADKLVAKLHENARIRKETAARFMAEAAELDGIVVCAADSVRSGNCIQGTRSWAAAHGLDVSRHYAPIELLSRSNGYISRVRLAIKAAAIRHSNEMSNGYSVIEDHKLPS